jgi:DNA-binding response OmpR family regulator
MLPAKQILLVGEYDTTLSLVRYLLSVNSYRSNYSCYEVTSANSAEEALGLLKTNHYNLLLCQYHFASIGTLLSQVKGIDDHLKTIVIEEKANRLGAVYADAILFKPTAFELLDRIKVLLYRKRGPLKGMKRKVASVEVPMVRKSARRKNET